MHYVYNEDVYVKLFKGLIVHKVKFKFAYE